MGELGSVGATIDFTVDHDISGAEAGSPVATLDDGATEVPVSSGNVITLPGVYNLTVTADDLAGNQASESRLFVVYDPSQGIATGGGWIIPGGNSSDLGDELPRIDSSSKATFGFVVKYQNGASENPSGQLEFQYHVGDFNLHSSGFDWLVVTNQNWAKFQGLATISSRRFQSPGSANHHSSGIVGLTMKVTQPATQRADVAG